MSQVPTEKQVYCYSMEGSRCLFADERVKKHLIDLVGEIRQRDGWLLFAFCIMDEAAYFIIAANRIERVVRGLQNAVLKQLLEDYRSGMSDKEKLRRNAGIELTGHTRKLGTLVRIADCCRRIHRLPLEQGCVSRLEDYWWSSYISYAGVHEWEALDTKRLLV